MRNAIPFPILGAFLPLFAFWVWMLIDCVTKDPGVGNDKVVWVIVICLGGAPGGAIYYFARRRRRLKLR